LLVDDVVLDVLAEPTDRKHAGSVIVNDGNGRFFEPGAGRKFLFGLEAQRRFY
jgi:iron complex outermembrane receptor protein